MERYSCASALLSYYIAEPWEPDSQGYIELNIQNNSYYLIGMCEEYKFIQSGIKKKTMKMYYDNMFVEILIAGSLCSKVQVHSWTYIRSIRSMSCMSCTHAYALSSYLQLSLASPAEYGMNIILERLCISPTEAIRQGDKPYMQQCWRKQILFYISQVSKIGLASRR